MKAITISTFLVFLSFCVIAQQKNDFLPNSLFYIHSICSIDSTFGNIFIYDTIDVEMTADIPYSKVQNISQSDVKKLITDEVVKGKIPVYDNGSLYPKKSNNVIIFQNNFYTTNKPKSIENISQLYYSLGGSLDTVYIEKEPNTYVARVVTDEYKLQELKQLQTIETWAYDTAKFTFTKHIEWYNFIRHYSRYGENKILQRQTFWIENQPLKKKSTPIKIATIEYEYIISDISELLNYKFNRNSFEHELYLQNNRNEGFNSYMRYILYSSIIDKVLANKIQAYDFNTNNPLSINEFINRCGYRQDTIYLEHPEYDIHPDKRYKVPKVITFLGVPDRNFISIIFTEELYFDPKTYSFYKKIIAISPVAWSFNNNGTRVKKEIAFKVYLN